MEAPHCSDYAETLQESNHNRVPYRPHQPSATVPEIIVTVYWLITRVGRWPLSYLTRLTPLTFHPCGCASTAQEVRVQSCSWRAHSTCDTTDHSPPNRVVGPAMAINHGSQFGLADPADRLRLTVHPSQPDGLRGRFCRGGSFGGAVIFLNGALPGGWNAAGPIDR